MVKINDTFGMLTVIGKGNSYVNPRTKHKKTRWTCRCSCGKVLDIKQDHLVSGHSKSCGHVGKGKLAQANAARKLPEGEETNDSLRKRSAHKDFKKRVKARDAYACFMCGTHKFLEVHHLYCFKSHVALRENDGNGITLCQNCHRDFHMSLGGFHVPCNTKDFYAWALQNGIDPNYVGATWIARNLLF